MFATDLSSTVFIIRPHTHFTPQQFLGRMAHKLFLSMLDQVGLKPLANSLHEQAERLPYSVSDLFSNGSQHFWLRVSGLTPKMSGVIQNNLAALSGQTVTVEVRDRVDEAPWECSIEAVIPSQHEWSRSQTYQEFVQTAWRTPRRQQFRLEFITPTAIKSVGMYRPFPLPNWVFRPLYDRLLRLEDIVLPFKPKASYLEAYAEHFLQMQAYNIRCVTGLPMKDETLAAFQGWIKYRVLSANEDFGKSAQKAGRMYRDESLAAVYADIQEHHDQYAALVYLLSQFAFYSGVGKYTGQGMGMVQINERALGK